MSSQMAVAAALPELAPMVKRYAFYRESSPEPVRRVEVPVASVALIFTFGSPLWIGPSADPASVRPFTSFVAGVHDRSTMTVHDGHQHGVQIDLSPTAAYSLLGVPMDELHNRVVPLADVLGRRAEQLEDQLVDAVGRGWDAARPALDEALPKMLAAGPPASPRIDWACDQLQGTGGAVSVSALAEATGWSHRHFIEGFRRHVGVTPSRFARLLRFERAAQQLRAMDPADTFADVAARCGYFDQAHMNREFREFAGCSPGAFLAAGL